MAETLGLAKLFTLMTMSFNHQNQKLLSRLESTAFAIRAVCVGNNANNLVYITIYKTP